MKENKNKICKNPLYVVKGKDVMEASGLVDMFLKKLNLEPMVELFQSILKLVLKNVSSYPALVAVKAFLDEFIQKYLAPLAGFVGKFAKA